MARAMCAAGYALEMGLGCQSSKARRSEEAKKRRSGSVPGGGWPGPDFGSRVSGWFSESLDPGLGMREVFQR